jgi:type I restriction enzyme S subunit
MSLPRYTRYRDSGVEWLGRVPEHWRVLNLGKVTADKCDGPFGSGLKSEHYTNEGIRVIRLQNIRNGGFDDTDSAFIGEAYYREELKGHDVQRGDLLIAGLGDERNTVGRACVAPNGIEPAMVKADCFRLRLFRDMALPGFIAAQLTAGASADAGVLSSGSTRSRIPLSVMVSRKLALPPIDEQSGITAFLDHEIGKIAALIEQQQRLIELLKEKRQAVISHAVTKGLNPDASMKDSGIQWLGEVPTHWFVSRLKNCCSEIVDCKNRTPDEHPEGEFLVVRTTCVRNGSFDRDGGYLTDDKSFIEWTQKGKPEVGDVLFTREAPTGEACLVPSDLAFCLGQRMMYLRPDRQKLVSEYLLHSIYGPLIRDRIDSKSKGSTVGHLRVGEVGELPILLPTLKEQHDISDFLDRELSKYSDLTSEANCAIDLLQERRTALISAAVTGKIDVRGLVEECVA